MLAFSGPPGRLAVVPAGGKGLAGVCKHSSDGRFTAVAPAGRTAAPTTFGCPPLRGLGALVAEKLEKLRAQERRCRALLGSILVPRQNEAQGR